MARDHRDDEALIEELAAIEHERWSHWQRYVHDKAVRQRDGSLVIPADLVQRWERQFGMQYNDLPEVEKESDREQVRRYLPVLKRWSQDDEKRSG
ncbi:hypothetical protein FV223_01330 [Methylobacterium sp. WL116]|nr:hypothetical protein FV223_01330 [Methylobacterium sp. WL116]